ncbi:MAG TPA: Ig-like domain-containing protein [Myxococcota bacterium]|nr:Ig-like domain-containing protein [Myxococcota bacterium]HOH77907.1 Ig-like domain-containing protein [Myxococcota bacterium]
MGRSILTRAVSRLILKCVMPGLLAVVFVATAGPANADTTVGTQTYSTDVIWTAAESPYLLTGNLKVAADATLTIEPGVTVKCSGYSGLVVNGTLVAAGTAAAPITFTKDAPESDPWDGIGIEGTEQAPISGSVLDHVIVEGGGKLGAGVLIHHASVTITNSTIRDSAPATSDGIRAGYGARLTLASVTLTGNGMYPLNLEYGGVEHSLSGITSSGNGIEAIRVGGGNMDGNRHWTDLGLPYHVTSDVFVLTGATFRIDPGVTLQFAGYTGLVVNGTLLAVGTAAAPITLTRDNPLSDPWDGISIEGAEQAPNQGSVLRHVIIEGGGKIGANLMLTNATASVSHSIIRQSMMDLVRAYGPPGTVIESSQLVEVEDGWYAVRNKGTALILAPHVWWGHPAGPTTDDTCNPDGSGTPIFGPVAWKPALESADGQAGPAAPLPVTSVEVRPDRWFAPADSTTRVWVKVTARDGNGEPLAGRVVHLTTTLGTAVDGAVTGADGTANAYLTSAVAGDATIGATLTDQGVCEAARVASATVTFADTAPNPLLPDAQAPYFSDRIRIEPLPVVQGVPGTVSADLTNPNEFPIVVDATLEIAQRGIGLVFGPLGSRNGVVIEAGATTTISVPWTPPLSGHYCVRLAYSGMPQPGSGTPIHRDGGSGSFSGEQTKNLDAEPGSSSSDDEKQAAESGGDSFSWFGAGFDAIMNFFFGSNNESTTEVSQQTSLPSVPRSPGSASDDDEDAMQFRTPVKRGQPPVQQYSPRKLRAAVSALSVQDAGQALYDATIEVMLDMKAAASAQRRWAAATLAGDMEWAARHVAALDYFKRMAGGHYLILADALVDYQAALRTDGATELLVTQTDVDDFLARLSSSGWTVLEQQAASAAGYSEDDIELYRQQLITGEISQYVGDLFPQWNRLVDAWRTLGMIYSAAGMFNAYQGPTSIAKLPSLGIVEGRLETARSSLVRMYETMTTFKVGNPTSATADIEIRVRRVDVPPDWTVTVTPAVVTLDPGATADITATIRPATAVPQGSVQRLAFEGYIGNTLIGGVVSDIAAPKYAAIAQTCDATLQQATDETCACDQECTTGLVCRTGACRPACDMNAPDCPEGLECQAWVGTAGTCETVSTPDDGGSGGCTADGSGNAGAGGNSLAVILTLALMMLGLSARRLRNRDV